MGERRGRVEGGEGARKEGKRGWMGSKERVEGGGKN